MICPKCKTKLKYIPAHRINFKSPSGFCYYCPKCHAAIGTHKSRPKEPIASIADKQTKDLRRECHCWFDKLWDNKDERENLYIRLSEALKIPLGECHFGFMDKDQLASALKFLKQWWMEKFDK